MKRSIIILSAAFILLSAASVFAAPPDDFNVTLNIEFRQSDARQMLGMINEFRKSVGDTSKGETAWYWNEGDAATTSFNGAGQKQLEELSYDYSLEEFAMVRAAEAAYRFGHTRPNGDGSLNAPEMSIYGARGENLAMNMSNSPSATFVQLREDDKNYAGQGHRRNMLTDKNRAVAIGIAVYNGRYYTSQLFGGSVRGAAETAPVNGKKDVSFTVKASTVGTAEEPRVLTPSVTVGIGGTADAPKVNQMVHCSENSSISFGDFIISNVQWVPDDASVVSLGSGGKLRGLKAGTTTIRGIVFGGKSVSASVTVSADAPSDDPSEDPSDDPSGTPGSGDAEVVGESAKTWSGGTVEFTVKSNAQFSHVICGGKTLTRMYDYLLAAGSAGSTVVTFTDTFLSTLEHGAASQIDIHFSDGSRAAVSVTPSGTAGDPSHAPSEEPSDLPTLNPSDMPSDLPMLNPSDMPSDLPILNPSDMPSDLPTLNPSDPPYYEPTPYPSEQPYVTVNNKVVPPKNTFIPADRSGTSVIFSVKGASPFGGNSLIMSGLGGVPTRMDRPFVVITCGAQRSVLTASLLTSQLGIRALSAQIVPGPDGVEVCVPGEALFEGQNSISLGGVDAAGNEVRTSPVAVSVGERPGDTGGRSSGGCDAGGAGLLLVIALLGLVKVRR